MTWRHGDVQILITIQVKDVEDIFYDVAIHSRFLVLYYRSELTNVNTALDKDTYQCTICKEKLYLKDPAQIREHPKLKVIICRVSIRDSKHMHYYSRVSFRRCQSQLCSNSCDIRYARIVHIAATKRFQIL